MSNEDAAAAGRLSRVERAPTLVRRAAIAFTDGNKWTSLHAAAAVGNAEAVSRLLAVGASTALRTATGADVVKIACDARQTEVVGVLRRHAAGVAGKRRKPRPPAPPAAEAAPPPETEVPDPTPTSEAPPPPPPARQRLDRPAAALLVGALLPRGAAAGGSKVETSGTPRDRSCGRRHDNVLYDDGDREIGIAAAFMRKEGSMVVGR